jgi:hypothetical protein
MDAWIPRSWPAGAAAGVRRYHQLVREVGDARGVREKTVKAWEDEVAAMRWDMLDLSERRAEEGGGAREIRGRVWMASGGFRRALHGSSSEGGVGGSWWDGRFGADGERKL